MKSAHFLVISGIITSLACVSCGGGSSASTSVASSTGGSSTGGGTGGTVPPNVVDLVFEDYHYHGGQDAPPITFHFRAANHNTQNVTTPSFPWVIRDQNGATVLSGTVPSLPAQAGEDVIIDYPQNPPGVQPYFIVLDPDNTIPETSKANNIAEVVPDAPPTQPPVAPQANELVWSDPHIHHPVRDGLAFHITVENIGTANATLTNVPWQITREDGSIVTQGVIASLPPGPDAAKQVETIFSTAESVGEHTYTWTIDPNHTISNDDPSNNVVHYIVVIQPAGDA